MTHKLTAFELSVKSELAQKINRAEPPHVFGPHPSWQFWRWRDRWAVSPATMEELGLVNGQRVNKAAILAILEAECASILARIAVEIGRAHV